MTFIQSSVEEYIHNFGVGDSDLQELLALNGSTDPSSYEYNDLNSSDTSNWSDLSDFTDLHVNEHYQIHQVMEKNELDLYLPKHITSCDIKSDFDCSSFLSAYTTNISEEPNHEQPEPSFKTSPFSLSESVGVTIPQSIKTPSHRIEIVYDLESEFKPRYKSDYFSQDGINRKPRYVADCNGNHFVTLQVQPGLAGCIRVDWVTTEIKQGIRYSMPYKFQAENDSLDIPDQNPLYVKFGASATGQLQLFLVLIKAKQDELKSIQALERFPPTENTFNIQNQNELKESIATSGKDLIRKYQLDKSQLAFTYCSLTPDGKLCLPEWDTTVYSTIMAEVLATSAKKRKVCCPNCRTHFEITMGKAEDIVDEISSRKRKTSSGEKKNITLLNIKKEYNP